MNGKIAINFNSISLAAALVLALSPSPDARAEKEALIHVTANSNSDASGPAFLNYAKEQQAQKDRAPAKSVEEKNAITQTTNKKNEQKVTEVSRQAAIITQKDKIIRQLRQQLSAKPATVYAVQDNQKDLTDKIRQLEKALTVAVAEKQRLIDKELSAAAEMKQKLGQLNATENKILLQEKKLASAESAKQKLESLLTEAAAEKQTLLKKLVAAETAQRELKTKLDAGETGRQALAAKLAAAVAEKQDLAVKLAAAGVENRALTAKLDSFTISRQQSAPQENAVSPQADENNALLQASADEISQLKARLADAETKSGKNPAAIDLIREPQQQAYSVGVSMGEEALKVLSTRSSQGIKISKDTVLQGILDSFSGKIALDEKARNKALFDVSKKVFQHLHKIEQQMVNEGKKYQQKFAKQKGVVFKDGVYSRIDYAGEGKILDSDTVTVTIKETLIDGTVINDMEAEGKVWSQTLKSYPPVFLGPIKRLGNHGSITVVIPPELAYGSEGRPPKIPPGATMVYSVRIVDATAAQPQAKNP